MVKPWHGRKYESKKKRNGKMNKQTNKHIKAIFVTLVSICCHIFTSFQALQLSTTQVTFFYSHNS